MKNILTINTILPTVDDHAEYFSQDSLRDYDIAIFDPSLPYMARIEFTGGGSCLTIENMERVTAATRHWSGEMRGALAAHKTIFVLLNELELDSGATGYTTGARSARSYSTASFTNYDALPVRVNVKNAKGKRIVVADKAFSGLLNALGEMASYKVVFEESVGRPIFKTKDGAVISTVGKVGDLPGRIVFIPHFDLAEADDADPDKWSAKSIRISKAIVSELVAIDKMLTQRVAGTPPPEWIRDERVPSAVLTIDGMIAQIDAEIDALTKQKSERATEKDEILGHARLLYETGKPLEDAIENGLKVLGFTVENYRNGDLEIDHIIVGPSGLRMVGESEGKDTSAIDITKFRQLESNINEDFERDEVTVPAKGILFANGYRLAPPESRAEQFTAKCLTNAKRLRTALVRTADLYRAVVCALDHPENESFKEACRIAIETSDGEIVVFPNLFEDQDMSGQT